MSLSTGISNEIKFATNTIDETTILEINTIIAFSIRYNLHWPQRNLPESVLHIQRFCFT